MWSFFSFLGSTKIVVLVTFGILQPMYAKVSLTTSKYLIKVNTVIILGASGI